MIFASDDRQGRARLEVLGLSWPLIEEVLRYGEAESRTCTENDPPGFGESLRWARHVRRLSERLRAQDWKRRNDLNQPSLVHPSNGWSVIVCSGGNYTGSLLGKPTNKHPKGASVQKAVRENDAGAMWTVRDLDPSSEGLLQTWVLLTLARGDRVFSELSLPKQMDGDFISDWHHRILLPSVDRSQSSNDFPEDDGGTEYDVPVSVK